MSWLISRSVYMDVRSNRAKSILLLFIQRTACFLSTGFITVPDDFNRLLVVLKPKQLDDFIIC
jgi:hypothetical protein